MTRTALSFLVVAAGCVPASEELPPAGAAGFVTEPSEATCGLPYTTDDGWEVRFDELVLRGYVAPTPVGSGSYGSADAYLWNARDRVELFAPGLSVGLWRVRFHLQGRYISPYEGSDEDPDDDLVILGVAPEIAERFRRRSDDVSRLTYAEGPSVYFELEARRGGRTVSMKLAIASDYDTSGSSGPEVEVREDALSAVPLVIAAENVFRWTTKDSAERTTFEPFAAADADGDGLVTPEELAAVPVEPFLLSPRLVDNPSLLDLLRHRMPAILVQ